MGDEGLATTVVRHLDYRLLEVAGEIDMSTAPRLREQIFGLIEECPQPLLVDLSGVSFCDSTGLNLAAAARKHAYHYGVGFAFVGLNARVDRVFRLTGMHKLIPTYATLPEAAFDLIQASLPD
ncbi:MAG TPA: STAS domain-containing protein [Streptosporangiaceae bacterium]